MKKDKTTKSKKRKMEPTSKKVSKKLKKGDYANLAKIASKSKLEAFIKRANEAYYNTGIPLMEDSEYDLVIDIMKERFPNSDVLSQIGAPIRSEIEKITLPYWMGMDDRMILPFFQEITEVCPDVALSIYETQRTKKRG